MVFAQSAGVRVLDTFLVINFIFFYFLCCEGSVALTIVYMMSDMSFGDVFGISRRTRALLAGLNIDVRPLSETRSYGFISEESGRFSNF